MKIIASIPHSSTRLPDEEFRSFRVTQGQLQDELRYSLDKGTNLLYHQCPKGLVDVNTFKINRLICDIERTLDTEPNAQSKQGRGVLYTRTLSGEVLRRISPEHADYLINTYYHPYHTTIEKACMHQIKRGYTPIILDTHSFDLHTMSMDQFSTGITSDICIGTDPIHTPDSAIQAIQTIAKQYGLTVSIDTPFSGTFIPEHALHVIHEIKSIKLKINKRLYISSTGMCIKNKTKAMQLFLLDICTALNEL